MQLAGLVVHLDASNNFAMLPHEFGVLECSLDETEQKVGLQKHFRFMKAVQYYNVIRSLMVAYATFTASGQTIPLALPSAILSNTEAGTIFSALMERLSHVYSHMLQHCEHHLAVVMHADSAKACKRAARIWAAHLVQQGKPPL
eukprot:991618-Karenia_brevis.AAC.1